MFSKFIGPVTSTCLLSLPETAHMVFTESLLARTMFARSIKVLGRRLGAEKSQEHLSPRKGPTFFKFHQPVAPLWVLYLPQNVHTVFRDCLLARANFAKSMKVLGWKTSSAKCGSTIFRKTGRDFLNFIGAVTTIWVL